MPKSLARIACPTRYPESIVASAEALTLHMLHLLHTIELSTLAMILPIGVMRGQESAYFLERLNNKFLRLPRTVGQFETVNNYMETSACHQVW